MSSAAFVRTVRRDELDTALFFQPLVKRVAVVGFVAQEPQRRARSQELVKRRFDQCDFMWRSTANPDGDRKTMAVCDCHDLAPFSPLSLTNAKTPFFAEVKEPSIKASDKSICPRFKRSRSSVRKIPSSTPFSTHSLKRRWHVWYGGYRAGRSCQGAPVRSTHRTPLSTSRELRAGRPRPSPAACSLGIRGFRSAHCGSVMSMPYVSAGRVEKMSENHF